MTTYIILAALVLLLAVPLLYLKPSQRNKKLYCAICCVLFTLVAGLRHITVGTDTQNYENMFREVSSRSWLYCLQYVYDVYFRDWPMKDPGYQLLVKCFQIFSENFQVYLFAVAAFFNIGLSIWIYKNSKDPCLSYVLYMALFFSFTMTGIRQTIAMAVVLFYAFPLLKKRRFVPFLLVTLLAATVHGSALIAIPFYFICTKKITRGYAALVVLAIPVAFILRDFIFNILVFVSGYEYEYYDGGGARNFTILLLLLGALTLLRRKQLLSGSENGTIYINALFAALVFVPVAWVNPTLMRVVHYFSMYLMLLLPEIVLTFRPRERIILYYVAVFVMLALFFIDSPQHLFFWQVM